MFAQSSVLRDVGKEIIEYLSSCGYEFQQTGEMDDLSALIDLFTENGFTDKVEIEPSAEGDRYIWHNLYGIHAYNELQKVTENPFLSCPLNACLFYLADRQGKALLLHSKKFDMDNLIVESQEEVVDKGTFAEEGFDPLVVENGGLR